MTSTDVRGEHWKTIFKNRNFHFSPSFLHMVAGGYYQRAPQCLCVFSRNTSHHGIDIFMIYLERICRFIEGTFICLRRFPTRKLFWRKFFLFCSVPVGWCFLVFIIHFSVIIIWHLCMLKIIKRRISNFRPIRCNKFRHLVSMLINVKNACRIISLTLHSNCVYCVS